MTARAKLIPWQSVLLILRVGISLVVVLRLELGLFAAEDAHSGRVVLASDVSIGRVVDASVHCDLVLVCLIILLLG